MTGYSPPVWSPDGQAMLFNGFREGDSTSWDWWVGPVSGGEPVRVAAPALGPRAAIRRTFAWRGNYVYYLEGTTQGGTSIYRHLISDSLSGAARAPCEGCSILDFFPSGRESSILRGKELVRLNTATGEQRSLADFTGLAVSDAALSPDGHWLAFTSARPDGPAAIFLTDAGQPPSPRDTWIQIAEDRNYLSRPIWSPDGASIYYGSTRDNFRCVWVQRIATGGRPNSAPAAALHLHGFKQSDFLGGINFAVSPESLYVLLAEIKGNAWMVKVDR